MNQPPRNDETEEPADLYDDECVVEVREVLRGEESIIGPEGLLIDQHEKLADREPRRNKVQGTKHVCEAIP